MALYSHCCVVCIKHKGPTFSGSELQSTPIRVGRWRQAGGLFNSPPNNIRASWSTLMIAHSTNLGLHQHTLHKGSARAKSVRVRMCVCVCVCVWLSDLTLEPRTVWVLYYLWDSCHFLLSWQCSNTISVFVTKDIAEIIISVHKIWKKMCVFEPFPTKED